jgi:hypothetical protein
MDIETEIIILHHEIRNILSVISSHQIETEKFYKEFREFYKEVRDLLRRIEEKMNEIDSTTKDIDSRIE